MECQKEKNLKNCTCTSSCPKRGLCCECVAHHRAKRQIPGCFFDKEGEATWDRSFEHFARLVTEKKI
ncbi:MAG: DUF6485 family protein [Planctomycetia bacterium]|nr:DUF6485 family protein [Planctomycetia bacterium]